MVFISDLKELLRSRWYQAYVGLFIALITAFFAFGLTESSVMGFTGLSRLLLTFIQANLIVLPIFVLVTNVRTFVGDRELGVWEYQLSWPIGLRAFYWGKALGRTFGIVAPLALGLVLAALYEFLRGGSVSGATLTWTILFLLALAACFTGISLLVSVLAPTQDFALGSALVIWLSLEAVVDALLLGLLLQQRLAAEIIIGLALLNPLQIFRIASIAVFDPELSALGPVALTLLEYPGRTGLCIWAVVWPTVIGMVCAWIGSRVFLIRDLTG